MRSFSVLFALMSLLLPAPAAAGPWMREKGTSFTALSFTITPTLETATSTYLEYGLRDDLTLGADIYIKTDRFGQQIGRGTLFFRRPLGQSDGPGKWAYELGIGADWSDRFVLPHLKTGLTWGRGITLRDKSGWVTVDAAMYWDISRGAHVAKVDSTLGLDFTERTAGMLQLYLTHINGAAISTIAPSIILSGKKGKYRIQIGVESRFGNASDTALKIGLWRTF